MSNIRTFCSLIFFLSPVPSSPVSFNLMQLDGEPNQLMASWSPPDPTNGIITAYTVYCRVVSDQGFKAVRPTLTGSDSSVTIMGLMPFTSYECYATANTSVGEGPPSNSDIAMTDEDGGLLISCMNLKFFSFSSFQSFFIQPHSN